MNFLVLKIAGSLVAAGGVVLCGYGVYKRNESKTVQDHLVQEKLILLDTTPLGDNYTSSKDYSDWKNKIKEEATNSGWKTFAEWTEDSVSADEKSKIDKLKSKCKEKLQTLKGTNNFSEDLKNTRDYCTKKTEK